MASPSRPWRSVVFVAVTGAWLLLVVACSSSNDAAAGGECFVATDCAPGLVCVEQPNKSRVCSNDLSRVTGTPPAMRGDAADDGGEGGATSDAPTGQPDSGRPDTGGPQPDSGGPKPDAGSDADAS